MTSTLLIDLFSEQRFFISNLCTFFLGYLVPDVFDAQIHGYHQQCYQKYTNAISIYKQKFHLLKSQTRDQEGQVNLEPLCSQICMCMICKSSDPITVGGKKQYPKKTITTTACQTLAMLPNYVMIMNFFF